MTTNTIRWPKEPRHRFGFDSGGEMEIDLHHDGCQQHRFDWSRYYYYVSLLLLVLGSMHDKIRVVGLVGGNSRTKSVVLASVVAAMVFVGLVVPLVLERQRCIQQGIAIEFEFRGAWCK